MDIKRIQKSPGLRRLLAALLLGVVASAGAATYTVTNANDNGIGSLRQAMADANANAGADLIDFNIAGTPPFTITLATVLPPVLETVSIDATTQPGWSNKPIVVLNGLSLATANGLTLNAGGNTIRGLVIRSFSKFGIEALSAAAGSNTIQGCFIGTDANGTLSMPNLSGGIHIGASSDNLIGGTNLFAGNVISGNTNDGIWIDGSPASARNVIAGNWIGTTWGGTAVLWNSKQGIRISAAQFTVVGGAVPGARNIISGNVESGVAIEGITSTNNRVMGNYVGLNGAGTGAIANGQYGVRFVMGAKFNTVGGTNIGEGNVISGNLKSGVDMNTGSRDNTIQGNLIGTSRFGTNAVPNSELGVAMSGTTNNLVGGTVAGARNIISGNANDGVALVDFGARSNRIEGNFIGVDISGTNKLGNGKAGIWVTNSPFNSIGSAVPGGGNVISGNGAHGISLHSAGAASNLVAGNLIGTDSTGTKGLGNGGLYYGIAMERTPGNIIGGLIPTARNVISSNNTGIYMAGTGASNNVILGNYIGSDITGMNPISNQKDGIVIGNSSMPTEILRNNVIGGSVAGAANVIVSHGSSAFRSGIYAGSTVGTVIQGNLIGVKADGVSPLGNVGHNVELDMVTGTVVGGTNPLAWNVIAHAVDGLRSGIRLRTSGTGNVILGNSIYSNGFMGITFSGTLVTPNDVGLCDADTGPNNKLNYPVIQSAVSDGITTAARGYLDSAAGQTYTLQFYASPRANPTGYGEGKLFLGTGTVTLGGVCSNSFVATMPAGAPAGWVVSATATDSANNTSEFSLAVSVGTPPSVFIQPDLADSSTLSWLVTNGLGSAWQLVESAELSPPVVWIPVTNTPTVASNGTWFTLNLSSTNSTRFFRLRFQ